MKVAGAFVKVLKTSVNFSYEKQVRRFAVNRFGNQSAAAAAADAFENEVLKIIRDFEKLNKKPDARLDFLCQYGWPADRSCKRNLQLQKDFLLEQLCSGNIAGVEAKIYQAVVRSSVPASMQKKCHISLDSGGFKASLAGSQQVVQQVFKTVGAASSWLADMGQADQDWIKTHANNYIECRYLNS